MLSGQRADLQQFIFSELISADLMKAKIKLWQLSGARVLLELYLLLPKIVSMKAASIS